MPQTGQIDVALPIILITGYLGSGKTTFLNQLLSKATGRRFAVIVNDFGAINVDETLIEGAVNGVVALENGCICCSLEGGLHSAIVRVLRFGEPPEAILIEASGVSNAGELMRILTDDAMRMYARLELIVSTFDCDHWQGCGDTERGLIMSQLQYADVVLATKRDLLRTEQDDATLNLLRNAAPGALVVGKAADLTMEFLLGGHQQRCSRQLPEPGVALPAHGMFRSWHIIENNPFTNAEFQSLLNLLPPETVRGKGYVHLVAHPECRFLFQMVGKRASVVPSGEWGKNPRRTELVFIATQNLSGSEADYSLTS
jgi:G3E family GTPase